MSGGPGATGAPFLTDRGSKRRLLVAVAARTLAIVAANLVIYAVLPIGAGGGATAAAVAASLGIVVILIVFGWQLARVSRSARPIVAAVEAVSLVFGLFICMFALLYVSISAGNPAAFSEVLTKAAGIYFTVTVLVTVGFGDITPVTDIARLIVTVQMIVGMTLIGSAIRALSFSARTAITARNPDKVAELQARINPPSVARPTAGGDPLHGAGSGSSGDST